MILPILATKLYIPPPRPKVVLRPRLVKQLNEGLQRTPGVTLISAPAGFGKTTLISEWVIGCHRQVAWLSVDEGDNDPARFLTYLVAALQTISPNIGAELPGMLQASQPQPLSFEPILIPLLNEIAAVTHHFILVLDDYQVIDAKPVDQILTYLLEHLPPKMHLVITTREDPNLPLARLRVRSQLTELRVADLRFTPDEAAGFLNQMMDLNLSAEDIAALEARTEGWIAGLQLAALAMIAMREHKYASSFIQSFTGTHHFVMDYLIEEVLRQQSESVQTFLLRTSILDRMCGPLCDAVWLDPGASGHETLAYIDRSNLFIVPLDSERHWYRYHQLFADLLRQRLGQSHTPEEIAQFHINASEWYEKNGEKAEAFRHLIAARDFNQAARLAETSWQSMNESFQSAAWLGWVKQLPEDLICSRPVLCIQIAWGFMDGGEVDASESRLRDAERCLEGSPDRMVIENMEQFRSLPARIAFVRTYNAQNQHDFISAVKYAQLALQLTPAENQFLRAQTAAILGATYWANGDLDLAFKSMSDWIDNSQRAGNFFFAIASASAKADIQIEQGHLREATKTLKESLELASAHAEAQRITEQHYLGLAMLSHEMGEAEEAAQHIQKSVLLGEQSMRGDWHFRRCVGQARIKQSEDDLETALDLLDEAQRFYVRSLIPNTHPIDAQKARIYLKQGRLDKAREWAREHGLSTKDDLNYLTEFEHITLARVLFAVYQDNREERVILEVSCLLERLLKAAEDGKRMGSVLEILVTQALVYQTLGSPSQAFASLEQALTQAQPEGYARIFIDEGDLMRMLLLDFRKSSEKQLHASHPDLTHYVDKLLSAFTPSKNMQQSNLIELLSPRELEVLRLIAQGQSNREISERLFLALSSIKGHNQMIFSKLQVQNRTEAVARARELGLL